MSELKPTFDKWIERQDALLRTVSDIQEHPSSNGDNDSILIPRIEWSKMSCKLKSIDKLKESRNNLARPVEEAMKTYTLESMDTMRLPSDDWAHLISILESSKKLNDLQQSYHNLAQNVTETKDTLISRLPYDGFIRKNDCEKRSSKVTDIHKKIRRDQTIIQ